MKTYYGVINSIFDNLKVTVEIIERQARERPNNSCHEESNCDIYVEWFETREDAVAYKRELLRG